MTRIDDIKISNKITFSIIDKPSNIPPPPPEVQMAIAKAIEEHMKKSMKKHGWLLKNNTGK